MSHTLKVGLPVPNVLIVDSVDHMLAQDEVGLKGIGLSGQEVRRDEVCLVNSCTLITTANGREHLLSQPYKIRLQVRQQRWRREVSGDRLVTVQQVLRIPLDHYINSVEQALQVTLLDKGRAEIRHEAVTHEHYLLVRQIDEHCVVSLTTLNRNQLYPRAADG